jgi:hypothetical protein
MNPVIAEDFFKELKHIGWNKAVREFRPFMNGDCLTMTNDELDAFLVLGRKYLPNAKNVMYSNGADSLKSDMFLNPLLDEIHFTVSASTSEMYRRIHGADKFNEVIRTFDMLINSWVSDKVYVHFIYNKLNEHELIGWKRLFGRAKLNISPLHYTDEQTTSLKILDKENMDKGYELGTTANPRILYFWHPCNCWSNMAISWKGEYIQCPDVHYKYNYGKVGEISIKDAWKNRANDMLNCKGCDSCNLKNSNQKIVSDVTRKWLKLF